LGCGDFLDLRTCCDGIFTRSLPKCELLQRHDRLLIVAKLWGTAKACGGCLWQLAEEPGERVEHDDRDYCGCHHHRANKAKETSVSAAPSLFLATAKRTLLGIAAQRLKAMTFPNNFCSECVFEALD
jgi:hypothetical protein